MCVTREIPKRQYPALGQGIVAIIVDFVAVSFYTLTIKTPWQALGSGAKKAR